MTARVGVGLGNYAHIFTDDRFRGPFLRIFIWTVVFAAMTVFLTLSLGLILAEVLNWESLRGRAVYYTVCGKGTVGSEPLRSMTAFYLDAAESVEIAAEEPVEILQLGMPKLSGMTASVDQAAA